MDSEFSEFSFGFALTHELINVHHLGLLSAPQLPSLSQEGQVGGGYDVRLDFGTFLFLQFKLSEFMIRHNAAQMQQMQGPYYRFWLMPRFRSLQHDMLIELEDSGEDVYYVAPMFHAQNDFNAFFVDQAVVQNSAFFTPLAIGEIDDMEYHCVAFNHAFAQVYSKPRAISMTDGSTFLRNGLRKRAPQKTIDVAGKMMGVVQKYGLVVPSVQAGSRWNSFDYVSFLGHVFFHCAVLFKPAEP